MAPQHSDTLQRPADGRVAILWTGAPPGSDVLTHSLGKMGWQVRVVPDEEEALVSAVRDGVDVVIAGEGAVPGAQLRLLRKLNKVRPAAKKILLLAEEQPDIMLSYTNEAGVDYVLPAEPTSRQLGRAVRDMLERMRDEQQEYLQEEHAGGATLPPGPQLPQGENSEELLRNLRQLEEKNRALTLLNESLRIQSTTDPLTGLFNRREFVNRIRGEWGRFKRYTRPLSLIMLDIDHFKAVNDTYGHECGDTVLRELGMLILRNKRGHDLCCRYGGEEFVVLLMETTLNTAFHVAEGLRMQVAEHAFRYGETLLDVNVSIGVSGAMEQDPEDVDSFIKLADQAMYHAKGTGRNRTVVVDPADPERALREST